MPSPQPYQDDDPPPPGSARLMGDAMGRLSRYRATAELRCSRGPWDGGGHLFHRNLMIALAIKAGMTHEIVGAVMGLSRSRITHILAEMESRLSRGDRSP